MPDAARTILRKDAGWRAVVAAFAFNGLLLGVWASRVPAFKDAFDLAPGALGLLLLALAGGAIVSFPLAGMAFERWGADRLTVWCAAVYGPALVMLALAPTAPALGVALFAFGAVHGAMDVAMNGWGARVEARTGRTTMSVYHALFSLGAGIGAASGYLALRWGLEPLWHFAGVAVLGGAGALAMMVGVREAGAEPEGQGGPRPLLALPSGPLLLVGLVAFAVSMGEGAITDWSALFLRGAVGATEAQAALGYAAFSATMVLMRLSGGWVVDRLGPVATTRASGGIAFAGLVVALTTDVLGVALAGFALVGIGYAVVMPLVFSRAASDPVLRPGPAIASVATLGYGGMLLGPPVIGFIAQATSLRTSFGVLALLAVLAVILAPSLRTPQERA